MNNPETITHKANCPVGGNFACTCGAESVAAHTHYKLKAMSYGIPEACADGLALYIVERIAAGSFVTAVLENDLREACGRADSQNRHLLFNYMNFLYNDVPSNCWGSRAKVQKWLS